jgi:hypothetical protein
MILRLLFILFPSLMCLIILNSCEGFTSFGTAPLPSDIAIKGTITDTNGELLDSVSVYLIYNVVDLGKFSLYQSNAENIYLNQNFPNPFENSTTISYEVADSSFLKIYLTKFNSEDTLQVFAEGNFEQGFYGLWWNDNIKNELYTIHLYKTVTEDSVYVEKIDLLRNNKEPDELIASGKFNLFSLNGSFSIVTKGLPLNKVIKFTTVSPTILDFKLISDHLTFVIFKEGYEVLTETHPINTIGLTNLSFVLNKN